MHGCWSFMWVYGVALWAVAYVLICESLYIAGAGKVGGPDIFILDPERFLLVCASGACLAGALWAINEFVFFRQPYT
jgi:hypothetical protein